MFWGQKDLKAQLIFCAKFNCMPSFNFFLLTACNENKNIYSACNENKTFPVLDCTANKIHHYFSCPVFFYGVKRQKAPATDVIFCKHENGLKLSITNPVRLYQRSQMFAV